MKTFTINDINKTECVSAIGFFDGVHFGHKYLLEQVRNIAKNRGIKSSVTTFSVHPRRVFNPNSPMPILNTKAERLQMIDRQGIDYCFVIDFDMQIAKMTAKDFMKNILKERFNVSCLVIGYDHRFGHNRDEGFEDYVRYGREIGIDIIQAKEFKNEEYDSDNQQISSSVCRELITAGLTDKVEKLLGYKYRLKGTVVGGHKIGRKIGFPTANIRIEDEDKIIPKDGIYAVWVYLKNKRYRGMLSIGVRPTINNGDDRSIEVYIIDFEGNIYGETIEVEFVKRTRDEEKFDTIEELIIQLKKDVEEGKRILI